MRNSETDSENITTRLDNDDNRSRYHHSSHCSLEPHPAILQVEAHVGQITNKLWLTRDLSTKAGPDWGVGRDHICSRCGGKDGKEKISDRVVAAKPDKGGKILGGVECGSATPIRLGAASGTVP